jgi:lipoyl-dependent peroxiredoxin
LKQTNLTNLQKIVTTNQRKINGENEMTTNEKTTPKPKIALSRRATAEWTGDLLHGSGRLTVGSGAVDVPYSVRSRFEDGQSATNPEELLGAAHAGCFTMALAAQLSRAQFAPTDIRTDANVTFEKIDDAFAITGIELVTSANVPGIDDATFQKLVVDAKQNCPVSKALAAVEIRVKATLGEAEKLTTSTPIAAR